MINVVIWKLEFSLIIVSCGAETSIHQCPAWIPGPSVWQWSITSHSHHISWNVTATNIYQHQTQPWSQPSSPGPAPDTTVSNMKIGEKWGLGGVADDDWRKTEETAWMITKLWFWFSWNKLERNNQEVVSTWFKMENTPQGEDWLWLWPGWLLMINVVQFSNNDTGSLFTVACHSSLHSARSQLFVCQEQVRTSLSSRQKIWKNAEDIPLFPTHESSLHNTIISLFIF